MALRIIRRDVDPLALREAVRVAHREARAANVGVERVGRVYVQIAEVGVSHRVVIVAMHGGRPCRRLTIGAVPAGATSDRAEGAEARGGLSDRASHVISMSSVFLARFATSGASLLRHPAQP